MLKIRGFPGEGIQNTSVLAIKTHSELNATMKFKRAILIVRNPKDAILAEFNRMKGGHIGYAKIEDFKKGECTQRKCIVGGLLHNLIVLN